MKENNELTRDDIAIDHDMEVDCDEGREIAVYTSARQCSSPEGGISMLRVGMDTRYGLYDPGC